MEAIEKIIGMLESNDEGIVRLGAILALGMGPTWCLETFKHLTMNVEINIKKRHNFPVLKSHPKLVGEKYVKDGVAISFSTHIICDYCYRINPSMSTYKVTILD